MSTWRAIDTDDLVGPAEVALVEAAGRFRPSRGTFRTFAYPRVHGACIDVVRRGERMGELVEIPVSYIDPAPGPALQASRRELAGILWQEVEYLPDPQREVIVRHFIMDQGVREIARDIGVHIRQVNQWLEKALGMLRVLCQRVN